MQGLLEGTVVEYLEGSVQGSIEGRVVRSVDQQRGVARGVGRCCRSKDLSRGRLVSLVSGLAPVLANWKFLH